MTKLKNNVFLTTALVLLMSGCASTDKPRTEATAATSAETPSEALVVQPITAPPTPAEIKDFGDRIQATPEALYSVVHNSYSLYLGGQYTAIYHVNDGGLDLVSDGGDRTCSYDTQAVLKDKADEAGCRQWLNDLNEALTRLSK